MNYPCWTGLFPCEHLKNISDADEKPEFACELEEEDCPYKKEEEE